MPYLELADWRAIDNHEPDHGRCGVAELFENLMCDRHVPILAIVMDDGARPWHQLLIQINNPRYDRHVKLDSGTELVIAADIARRLHISPQRVQVLAAGHDFPAPLGKLGRSAVWRWNVIEQWARDTGRLAHSP